jgi:secondary thiamine-phosphate synthase enzyme
MIETKILQLETRGNADVIDITKDVERALRETKAEDGIVTVFVSGSTGAVTTIEYEPGLVKDIRTALDKIAPQGAKYEHDKRWGDGNGHSHVRASLIGPSLTVPFVKREMQLGTWQQIVFIDLDNRARQRRLIVQVMGE